MRARIQHKLYVEWPGHIRRRLMALTLRERSGMRIAIQDSNKRVPTFVLFEEKHPVAWSLAEWDKHEEVYNLMVYVRRDKRKLGYGRQVFTQAKRWVQDKNEKYCVFPDYENTRFFQKVGEKV